IGSARTAQQVIEDMGVGMVSDEGTIRKAVEDALAAHPNVVQDLRSGKKNAFNFLVGQVMRATKGKANPNRVAELIQEKTRDSP
ncbi:MAG: Asp-tRNA(Asn)/Glu-tRNA(Gln) amidotransferase GatCAB subunit B, partial [Planctomycetes bacterium]|nr:Asp-tRNA(Asn)/Glu-tRNA(Gln) amidotransferase GatCAB subunit B [Planctomycetota bacterium]